MAYCFKKARTPVATEGRNKVLPCISLTFIKAATIRPSAIYFELSKSFTFKRGRVKSSFLSLFCVVWCGRSIHSLCAHWAVVFQLLGNSWRFSYILHEIGNEISRDTSRDNTPMQKALMTNWQLAISLYYLPSTTYKRAISIYWR